MRSLGLLSLSLRKTISNRDKAIVAAMFRGGCAVLWICASINVVYAAAADKTKVLTRHLEVTYSSLETRRLVFQDDWRHFCKAFSEQFLLKKGPEGRGIFKSVNCQEVLGPDVVKPIKDLKSDWIFAFAEVGDALQINVIYQAKNAPVFTFEFPKTLTPEILLSNPVALQFAVAQVYRRMPMAWCVELSSVSKSWSLPGFESDKMPGESPTSQVIFYKLEFDDETSLWLPSVRAIATKQGDSDSDSLSNYGASLFELKRLKLASGKSEETFWAQELFDKDSFSQTQKIMSIFEDSKAIDHESLRADARAQIFLTSIRVYQPIPKASTALSQTPKFEIDFGLQKGWLNGLNLSFETIDSKSPSPSLPYSFYWSRWSLGWAMKLGSSRKAARVSSQFRIAPRIGVLSFDLNYPSRTDDIFGAGQNSSFFATNQLDLGAEISWELQMNAYTFWIYGANHLSGYVLKKAAASQTTNQKVSSVLHYRSPFRPFGIALGFEALGQINWLSVRNNASKQASESLGLTETVTVDKASTTIFYAGLGLSLNW